MPLPLASRNLNQRILSALVLTPLVLGFVWTGGVAYKMLVISAMILGMHEWLGLTIAKLNTAIETTAMAGLLAILAVGGFVGYKWGLGLAAFVFLALFYFAQDADSGAKGWMRRAIWAASGVPYLAFGGLGLMHVRGLEINGLFATVYLLATVWGTDIGGYFAGRAIGGPKLAPRISPNKTWAGLGGGMALAAALGYAAAWGFGDSRPWMAALFGTLVAVISQAGDFFESYVKRRAGKKDSGALIPGHGGLLDRVDGLLFAAMAWSFYLGIHQVLRG